MANIETAQTRQEVDALVIGAGFSGLYMLYRLRDVLGLDVKVVDSAPSVGGTWYWNRYPGARCDTESYIYCYGFSPELYQEWNWSRRYPLRDEILGYLNHVADRFDLRRNIVLDTLVTKAEWDAVASRWIVETEGGTQYAATFLVTAIGILTAAPYMPDIPGIDQFAGEIHHTRDWPESTPDWADSAVGVMGTGSTGAQLIPALADSVRDLTVLQRTPQFMVPGQDSVVDRAYLDHVKENYEAVWDQARWSVAGMPWGNNGRSAWDDSPDERRETWDSLWAQGGQRFMQQNYKDALTDPKVSEELSDYVREKIVARVDSPEVAEVLMPRSYLIGGRRTVIESGYFESFNAENVHVVDVLSDPIESVEPDGLRLESGTHIPLDVLILATGFDAVTGPFLRVAFHGTHGQTLNHKWKDGPHSFLGMAMSGFPNMFMVTGPGSTFGNHAVLMEHQVEWISSAIAESISRGATTVEASEEAETDWMQWVDEAARSTVQFGTKSWFNGANIPGKPEGPYVFLGSYRKYRRFCDRVASEGFRGLVFD